MHHCIYSQITIRDFLITKQPFFYDMICLTDVMCDQRETSQSKGCLRGMDMCLLLRDIDIMQLTSTFHFVCPEFQFLVLSKRTLFFLKQSWFRDDGD